MNLEAEIVKYALIVAAVALLLVIIAVARVNIHI